MIRPVLLALSLTACGGGATMACEDVEDPCAREACETCVETCGSRCAAAESFPVQYTCPGDGSWTGHDACEDWDPFDSGQ